MGTINAYDKVQYANVVMPTLQEKMMAPMYLQEKHDAAEQELGALTSEANSIEQIANSLGEDSALKANYNNYINTLRGASNELLDKGWNAPGVKQKLLSAKNDYTTNIVPIQKAWEVKTKDDALINDIVRKNPSAIVDYGDRKRDLDSYASSGYQSVSPNIVYGDKLANEMAAAVKPLADIATNDPTFKKTAQRFTDLVTFEQGITPEGLNKIVNILTSEGYDPNMLSMLEGTLLNTASAVLINNGVQTLSSPENVQRAINAGIAGLNTALGSPKYQLSTNQGDLAAYKRALATPKATPTQSTLRKPTIYLADYSKEGERLLKEQADMQKRVEELSTLEAPSIAGTLLKDVLTPGSFHFRTDEEQEELKKNANMSSAEYRARERDKIYNELVNKGYKPASKDTEDLRAAVNKMNDRAVEGTKAVDLDLNMSEKATMFKDLVAAGAIKDEKTGKILSQREAEEAFGTDKNFMANMLLDDSGRFLMLSGTPDANKESRVLYEIDENKLSSKYSAPIKEVKMANQEINKAKENMIKFLNTNPDEKNRIEETYGVDINHLTKEELIGIALKEAERNGDVQSWNKYRQLYSKSIPEYGIESIVARTSSQSAGKWNALGKNSSLDTGSYDDNNFDMEE